MTQRQEIIERLNGLELEGGSHEMLNAICKAVLPHSDAWTLRMCEDLRDRLVRLLGEADDDGFVRLPKDADGEYIHIGDRMENNERVARIVLTDDSWEPSVYLEKLPNVLHEYFCHEISHYHAPTVEDVLREMYAKLNEVIALYVGEAIDSDERDSDEARIFAEYAAKLQLKENA